MNGPAQDAPSAAPHYGPVDVLILGAGLAGMRAGIAALAVSPGVRVCCLSLGVGPAGSSFLNQNNALGMQVLADAPTCEAYVRRAVAIAPPGHVDTDLVALMAEESLPRLEELRLWGAPIRGDHHQDMASLLKERQAACFFQEQATAFIFPDLTALRHSLLSRFLERGGRLLEGVEVLGLCRDASLATANVRGALLRKKGEHVVHVMPARSVIMALGGPAPLYERNICGPAVQGYSYALLQRAGAPVRQAGLLQFLWHFQDSRQFVSPHFLANQNWRVRGGDSPEGKQIPEHIRALAGERATHCPFAYAQRDNLLDRFLLAHAGTGGVVALRSGASGSVWRKAALMAQAGNGGARIDLQGRTCVQGLFACGESATGMHGGNRIGGGMVLASLVFGARAGHTAAQEAIGSKYPKKYDIQVCGEPGHAPPPLENDGDAALRRHIRRLMQENAVCGGNPEALPAVLAELEAILQRAQVNGKSMALGDRLFCESAAIIVRHLLALHAGHEEEKRVW